MTDMLPLALCALLVNLSYPIPHGARGMHDIDKVFNKQVAPLCIMVARQRGARIDITHWINGDIGACA